MGKGQGTGSEAGKGVALGRSPGVFPRARRAAEPVGMGAAAAGAAPRAAGPSLALEPLLRALARAGEFGASHVLVRAEGKAGKNLFQLLCSGDWVPAGCEGPLVGCPCRPEEERLRLLKGTGVPEAVEKDLVNIRSEYYSIVLPFMEAHSDLFSPTVRSLELYSQLVALVMAYR